MLARVVSKLILLVSPFVLAILSANELIANALNSPEPMPITLTEISGKVQKLSPKEGVFRDVVLGEVIEINEQVLTHKDSSTWLDLPDNWDIQMEPLSTVTIQKMNREEKTLHTRIKFEVGTIDISLSVGALDVETPSGMISLHGPARAYIKVKMNSGETWASCVSGVCNLEKEKRRIALSPGQVVTFSRFDNLPAPPVGVSPALPMPIPVSSTATFTPVGPPARNSGNTINCGPPEDWVIHVVQVGETLESLSQIYQVSIESLQEANCLRKSTMVTPGSILFVPPTPLLSSPTPTPTNLPPADDMQATATKTPKPTATKTPVPNATNTPKPTATKTPVPNATNTPKPTATNTPVPNATDTPKPTATNTPVSYPTDTPTPSPTNTSRPTATNTAAPTATDAPTPTNTSPPLNDVYYVDVNDGSDSNPGSLEKPWQTMIKAFRSIHAGDTLYMRGGVYTTSWRSGMFVNSGTASKPITVTNYPGETVTIQVTDTRGVGWEPFMCWADADGTTPKADYIRIIGTDKGLVLKGATNEEIKTSGIWGAGDCDNWEVSGVVFEGLKSGIFQYKYNNLTIYSYGPDNWYIHDNIITKFYGETGFQINGNYNRIENNLIYKTADIVNLPYGCAHVNILGNHNIVNNNVFMANGSSAACTGILFEWDIADYNIIENNFMDTTGWGDKGYVNIAGGDNNIVRYNEIIGNAENWYHIWSGTTVWPCNEPDSLIPANDPRAPDYEYYYPHDCKSVGNQIYDNTYISP